jgi:hypothetical protein
LLAADIPEDDQLFCVPPLSCRQTTAVCGIVNLAGLARERRSSIRCVTSFRQVKPVDVAVFDLGILAECDDVHVAVGTGDFGNRRGLLGVVT